ncbi:LOW QUALITY PROTEIN: solute carrier family 45 member 4-like [Lethenteron reissneri]|uniref:LOW QUALITY PROTEIN: solute carrier family 45 member 4-like n=1 Tax=Lethenteron reissneri TaxID=7753 RepID=UPI002AB63D9A|nr:LOW QUALITY PROTEIN: solute carrier family 45 member 4-like [Lethenteron reissneri]
MTDLKEPNAWKFVAYIKALHVGAVAPEPPSQHEPARVADGAPAGPGGAPGEPCGASSSNDNDDDDNNDNNDERSEKSPREGLARKERRAATVSFKNVKENGGGGDGGRDGGGGGGGDGGRDGGGGDGGGGGGRDGGGGDGGGGGVRDGGGGGCGCGGRDGGGGGGEVALQAKVAATTDDDEEDQEEEEEADEQSEDGAVTIKQWVMHGAIMFGREFCYAMETALVTPVLLQIGLPEKYYSLTWFLSPVLGLIFTPLIGSASDRCRSPWGRRRPFILVLCVGVLLGITLFLNGANIGRLLGDGNGDNLYGIVLSILGVVMLDFCADASEGPIRAYLLDVVESEEQDTALNIHSFSAGLGGAVGYMSGGLNWTGTFLGRIFHSQEQILFFFTSIIFSCSVVLHLFSIPEEPYVPLPCKQDKEAGGSIGGASPTKRAAPSPRPLLREDDEVAGGGVFAATRFSDETRSENELCLSVFNADLVRSKSDSALHMSDSAMDVDSEHGFLCRIEPSIFDDSRDGIAGRSVTGSSGGSSGDVSIRCRPSGFDETALSQTEADNANRSGPGKMCDRSPPETDKQQQSGTVEGATGHSGDGLPSRRARRPACRARGSSLRQQGSCRPGQRRRSRHQQPHHHHQRAHAGLLIKPSRSTGDIHELAKRQRLLCSYDHHQHCRLQRRHEGQSPSDGASCSGSAGESDSDDERETVNTVRLLWLSMLRMPRELRHLCTCHLFTWFALISAAVFYTDFMGQMVYSGDPTAPANSTEVRLYNSGVQMGCWGLTVYALTAAAFSAVLQKYMSEQEPCVKGVYCLGTLGFSVGMSIMAAFPNVYVSMVMISTMGLVFMSIAYCPYALLGQYHELKEFVHSSPEGTKRGFGVDCAILSCQVYISQILVASALSGFIQATGSVRVVPIVAAIASFIAFLVAAFLVVYPAGHAERRLEKARAQAAAVAAAAAADDDAGAATLTTTATTIATTAGSSATAKAAPPAGKEEERRTSPREAELSNGLLKGRPSLPPLPPPPPLAEVEAREEKAFGENWRIGSSGTNREEAETFL